MGASSLKTSKARAIALGSEEECSYLEQNGKRKVSESPNEERRCVRGGDESVTNLSNQI